MGGAGTTCEQDFCSVGCVKVSCGRMNLIPLGFKLTGTLYNRDGYSKKDGCFKGA